MPYLIYLECKNDKQPIPLLYSKHPPLLGCPKWWPKGNQPVNFLCPSCRHVYGYPPSMIRQGSLEELGVHAPDTGRGVFLIAKQCVENNCGSLVKIHAIMSAVANDVLLEEHSQQVKDLLDGAIPVDILCESHQHTATTQSLRECSDWRLMVVAGIPTI